MMSYEFYENMRSYHHEPSEIIYLSYQVSVLNAPIEKPWETTMIYGHVPQMYGCFAELDHYLWDIRNPILWFQETVLLPVHQSF